MSQRSKWSLIGIPDHLGVIHVGGRIGAAAGPAAFRRLFSGFTGRENVQASLKDCGDAGPMSGDIRANLEAAATLVERAHKVSGLSVVVGGGHDHGYSHLTGVFNALGMTPHRSKLGCINIDAHLDVRKPDPLITSGSPFYLALESGILDHRHFVEFGIQPQCNSQALWAYVEERKVRVVPFEGLRQGRAIAQFKAVLKKLAASCDAVVVSLDLDAIEAAHSPGVSAPQSEGFTPGDIMQMMEAAGEETAVVSLGIFELNPEHDADDRTARLAATSAHRFVTRALSRA